MPANREWQAFELSELSRERLNLDQKYRILDGLYEEAVHLGAFPLKDRLEGIDVDIRIARVINRVPKAA